MNHNYKLGDFRKITGEADTDIQERIVSVKLKNVKELPEIIIQRLENLINKLIVEHEQKYNVTIPLENMDVSIGLSIDTEVKEFYLSTYIGYDINKEFLVGKEVMTAADEDYSIIKKYFFNELSNYIFEQVRCIQGCVA